MIAELDDLRGGTLEREDVTRIADRDDSIATHRDGLGLRACGVDRPDTAAAGVIVTAVAAALRHPLTAVPENLLKFIVGAMLTTFGIFWFGEGVGAEWPGDAASIPVILGLVLVTSWVSVRMLGAVLPEGARVEARNV